MPLFVIATVTIPTDPTDQLRDRIATEPGQNRARSSTFEPDPYANANGTLLSSSRTRPSSNRVRLPSNRTHLPSNWTRLPVELDPSASRTGPVYQSNWTRLPTNWACLPSNRARLPSNRARLPVELDPSSIELDSFAFERDPSDIVERVERPSGEPGE